MPYIPKATRCRGVTRIHKTKDCRHLQGREVVHTKNVKTRLKCTFCYEER